ncbi:hypothetical protein VLK31_32775 [Variovorax sp. H27-G14]|uniref:hypothetical protein n=1 Tax=Variovorax sp. H27-G14 TaxID=3111914 RepID=UPI0038FC12AD
MLSDFIQVLSYLKPDSVIAFHDANLIIDAIQNAERMLRYLKIEFETVFLPDCVAAIGIRGMAAPVREMLLAHAHERATYVQRSKKQLQQMVAMSLFEAGNYQACETLRRSLKQSKMPEPPVKQVQDRRFRRCGIRSLLRLRGAQSSSMLPVAPPRELRHWSTRDPGKSRRHCVL